MFSLETDYRPDSITNISSILAAKRSATKSLVYDHLLPDKT